MTDTASVPDPGPGEHAGEKASLYVLLPACALAAAAFASMFAASGWGRFILPLEVLTDIFIAAFAFRWGFRGARYWRAAAVLLLAGDTFYFATHFWLNLPPWVFMTQEAFYTLSRFMTAAYFLDNLPAVRELEAGEKALLGVLFAAISFFSYYYLLRPVFSQFPVFFQVNGVLNRLAESFIFPLAVMLGMRARTKYWLGMTHGIVLLSISSIAISYYMALKLAAGVTPSGIPVQEYGWLFGLIIILAAQAYRPGRQEPFSRWNSARVRLAWLVLSFNLALLAGLYLVRAYEGGDVFRLSSVLFVLFGLWLIANLVAFKISGDLNRLLESVGPDGAAPFSGVAVHEAELFAGKLRAAYDTIRSQARLAERIALAEQVAHDIRSPLAALDSALGDAAQIPEEKRGLVRGAVGRIKDIADDLLKRNRRDGAARGAAAPVLLSALVDSVVAEKRQLLDGRKDLVLDVNPGSGGLRAAVSPAELSRVLSNLINNAVEALPNGGSVKVGLAREGDAAALAVSDNGPGMTPEALAGLGRRGNTHGKEGGSGLGLHHAMSSAESWGGGLRVDSEPGKGTTVTLILPLAGCAAGPGPVPRGGLAVLLDDDALVRLNWNISAKAAGIELRTYLTGEELLEAAPGLSKDTPLFIDIDLGGERRGDAVARELRSRGFSDITMVTGYEPGDMQGMEGIRISGKEPPWGQRSSDK